MLLGWIMQTNRLQEAIIKILFNGQWRHQLKNVGAKQFFFAVEHTLHHYMKKTWQRFSTKLI